MSARRKLSILTLLLLLIAIAAWQFPRLVNRIPHWCPRQALVSSTSLEKEYFALLQQYQITKIQRMIADEKRAIFEDKQAIYEIKKSHPHLPSDEMLGIALPLPDTTFTLLSIQSSHRHRVATLNFNGRFYHVSSGEELPNNTKVIAISANQVMLQNNNHKWRLSLEPYQTKQKSTQQLQPEEPKSTLQQRPHMSPKSLELSPQETKSFKSLESFIAEKKQHSPAELTADEKHLLAIPPKYYTIQLYGARQRHEVEAYIHQYHLDRGAIFHSYYLNQPWYALVVGKFKSYHDAVIALSHMPKPLKANSPWIRPMSSVHAAIKLYR